MLDAWEPIADYERYWTPFDERFRFRPDSSASPRPGIIEPPGSVTFSLAPMLGLESRYVAYESAINAEVLRAFVDVFDEGERLIALDWQHPGYWFRPHAHAATGDTWRITPVPSGDYHIFLTEDLSAGTFGHPWEWSLCVFGDALVRGLAPALATFLPILRQAPDADVP